VTLKIIEKEKIMSEYEVKPTVPVQVAIVGSANFSPPSAVFEFHSTFESVSYTVGASAAVVLPFEPANQVEALPSEPLSAGAIRVINSVLGARVPDSAFERD
jgi:hypothetical protein